MSAPLEARIAKALTGDVLADDVAVLVTETETTLATVDAAVEEERAKALDLTASPDPVEARTKMEAVAFERDRLRDALPRLRKRLEEVRAAEYLAAWMPDFERVRAERDRLAADYAERYPSLVAEMQELLSGAEKFDKGEISRINSARPNGHEAPLLGVELVARSLQGFTVNDPPIAAAVRLPQFNDSKVMAWPPPQVPLGVQYVASMRPLPHPGANWQEHAKRREQALREEAARVAAHYDEQERIREENNARAERERDERRRNG